MCRKGLGFDDVRGVDVVAGVISVGRGGTNSGGDIVLAGGIVVFKRDGCNSQQRWCLRVTFACVRATLLCTALHTQVARRLATSWLIFVCRP